VSLASDIATRLDGVRRRIAQAAAAAHRDPAQIRLVAVSKTFGVEHVAAAVAAGQRDFGENRVQEGLQKMSAGADVAITWHLIGHLQANKARKAAEVFRWIHSIDSVALLDRLDRAASEAGAAPHLLVQVDLANEPTKHGATEDMLPSIFERAGRCAAARVGGLMLLPPYAADPEAARPYFRRLREVRDALQASGVPPALLGELSMGMGTAIFGGRSVV
jgi:pyridoxal phosphate enzyme (YggS family)